MSVLEAQVHIGLESEYSVAVTPNVSLEVENDNISAEREDLESIGMRAGLVGLREDRQRSIVQGASGTLEVPMLTRGLEALLAAAVGYYEFDGSGARNKHTFIADPLGSDRSFTAVVGRPDVSGNVTTWTYPGGRVVSWKLSQAVGEVGKLECETNFANETFSDATAMPTPAYPEGAQMVVWGDSSVQYRVQGADDWVSLDTKQFELSVDNALDVERRFLRNSTWKKKPVRAGLIVAEGSLECEFDTTTLYNLIHNNTVCELRSVWETPLPAGGTATITVEFGGIVFRGETPNVSLDSLPEQSVSFKGLDAGQVYPTALGPMPGMLRVTIENDAPAVA